MRKFLALVAAMITGGITIAAMWAPQIVFAGGAMGDGPRDAMTTN